MAPCLSLIVIPRQLAGAICPGVLGLVRGSRCSFPFSRPAILEVLVGDFALVDVGVIVIVRSGLCIGEVYDGRWLDFLHGGRGVEFVFNRSMSRRGCVFMLDSSI